MNHYKISKEELLKVFFQATDLLEVYEKKNRCLENEVMRLENLLHEKSKTVNAHFKQAILSEN